MWLYLDLKEEEEQPALPAGQVGSDDRCPRYSTVVDARVHLAKSRAEPEMWERGEKKAVPW